MMQLHPNAKRLFGQKFGKLTAIEPVSRNKHGLIYWRCLCDCGKESVVISNALLMNGTKSCGCLKHETKAALTHGRSKTKIYNVWLGMRNRCNNPATECYPRYGGRGINVCEHWQNSFENFYEDMGEAPKGMTLERIDNAKGYDPSNCKWGTPAEQCRNRRSNRLVEIDGVTKCLKDWANESPVSINTILSRIYNLQWPAKEAILTPALPPGATTGRVGNKLWWKS